ncbi:5952_t:CDS:1, partial [Funneliformis geosporum]
RFCCSLIILFAKGGRYLEQLEKLKRRQLEDLGFHKLEIDEILYQLYH